MNVIIKGKKTGAEIWEIIQHELLNETGYIPDRLYDFILYDKETKQGIKYSESKLIPTQEEIEIEQRETAKQEVYGQLQKAIDLDNTELIVALRAEYTDLCNGCPVKCISTLDEELTESQLNEEKYLNIIMEDGGVW